MDSKELARAVGENAVAFVKNPGKQSLRAYEVAQGMAKSWADDKKQRSPLKPEHRPGVPVEALKNGGLVKSTAKATPYKCGGMVGKK